MAYALGYDKTDFESDDEDGSRQRGQRGKTGQHDRGGRSNSQRGERLPDPMEMDTLDSATLEKLGWMEPLGYRALSKVTGLHVRDLRRHFWASKLKPSSDLYFDIDYYFRNSHSHGHGVTFRMKRVINLKRFNENNCDYKDPNVQLLWHGTSIANVGGILTNGFRLPMHNGMFGRGIYFADRVTKSTHYCFNSQGGRDGRRVLFLCAVNLGRMYKTLSAMSTVTAPPPGFDSVKGCGINVPDRSVFKTHRGAYMPCGKTVNTRDRGRALQHNEYIVYNLNKIAILFLVEFE